MTIQEFLALLDRDKDALVAEKVMGWKWKAVPFHWDTWGGRPAKLYLVPDDGSADHLKTTDGGWDEKRRWHDMPGYSTDIAAAWEVRGMVHEWIFSKRLAFKRELQLAVSQRVGGQYVIAPEEIILLVEPVDICLGALVAVGAIR